MKHFVGLIAVLCGLLGYFCASRSAKASDYSYISPAQQIERVPFCELIANPSQYHQKLITTEAIVVITFIPGFDGGETLLYSQDCNREGFYVLSDYPTSRLPARIHQKFRYFFSDAQKKNTVGRVEMLITGRFYQAPENSGFGHLSWSKFKLDTKKVAKATYVPDETPWPSSWEKK